MIPWYSFKLIALKFTVAKQKQFLCDKSTKISSESKYLKVTAFQLFAWLYRLLRLSPLKRKRQYFMFATIETGLRVRDKFHQQNVPQVRNYFFLVISFKHLHKNTKSSVTTHRHNVCTKVSGHVQKPSVKQSLGYMLLRRSWTDGSIIWLETQINL